MRQPWCGKATLWAVAATGLLTASAMVLDLRSDAGDIEDPLAPIHEHPAHGTRFWFEVIEVWVDLNPAEHAPPATAADSPAAGSAK